jgi:hypothetical protein
MIILTIGVRDSMATRNSTLRLKPDVRKLRAVVIVVTVDQPLAGAGDALGQDEACGLNSGR